MDVLGQIYIMMYAVVELKLNLMCVINYNYLDPQNQCTCVLAIVFGCVYHVKK